MALVAAGGVRVEICFYCCVRRCSVEAVAIFFTNSFALCSSSICIQCLCFNALTRFQQFRQNAHLSQVELEDVADVVRRVIRQLNQVLPIFKSLAELLHT